MYVYACMYMRISKNHNSLGCEQNPYMSRPRHVRKLTFSSYHTIHVHTWPDGGGLAAIGGRDNSLFLFRALGKILYCKRDTVDAERKGEGEGKLEDLERRNGTETGSPPSLPAHLQQHERSRLLVDPEVL